MFDLVALRAQERDHAFAAAEVTGARDDEIDVPARKITVDFWDPGAIARAQQPVIEGRELLRFAVHDARQRIRITATSAAGALRLEVRDSGPGFELTKIHSGHGLENLIDRLEMLYGSGGRVEVARQDGECVVALVVPQPQPA